LAAFFLAFSSLSSFLRLFIAIYSFLWNDSSSVNACFYLLAWASCAAEA